MHVGRNDVPQFAGAASIGFVFSFSPFRCAKNKRAPLSTNLQPVRQATTGASVATVYRITVPQGSLGAPERCGGLVPIADYQALVRVYRGGGQMRILG